ncbi:MAG: hypothetical protein ACK452_11240 [Bacteroidota bacterium]
MIRFVISLIIFSSIITLTSCRKETNCFDQELYDKHRNDGCTTDCPGVLGCDGKTYCNECEARRQGIKVQ